MGTTEEYLRLLVDIKGAAALPDLKQALANVGLETANLSNLFGQNAISEDLLEKETRRLAQSQLFLKDAINQVEHGIGTSTNKMAGLGQAGLQAGYALQDFAQGGIAGILNNIPGLVQSLGGGPGLAGALGALGVAAFILKPHLAELAASLGFTGEKATTAKGQIEELKKKVDELEKKTGKLNIDVTQLNEAEKHLERLEKRLAAFNAAKGTTDQDELAAAAKKVTKGTIGSEGLLKAVAETDAAAGRTFGTAEDAAIIEKAQKNIEGHQKTLDDPSFGPKAKTRAGQGITLARQTIEAAMARNDAAAIEHARGKVGDFETGDVGAIAEMKNRAKAHPGAFGKDFTEAVGAMPGTPGEVREARVDKVMEEIRIEGEKDAVEFNEKKKKANAKFIADLNQQGIDNQIAGEQALLRTKEEIARKTTAGVTRAGAAFGRDVAGATREVEKSNIDEQADAAAASLRAAGGYTNARGQFVKQDEDQQRQTVIEDVMKQIRQQFPNMGKMQAQGVASKIADKSFAEVDRMTAQGMDAIGTTQANLLLINAELMNEMGRINTKLRKVGGESINQVDRLRSDARSRVPGT